MDGDKGKPDLWTPCPECGQFGYVSDGDRHKVCPRCLGVKFVPWKGGPDERG